MAIPNRRGLSSRRAWVAVPHVLYVDVCLVSIFTTRQGGRTCSCLKGTMLGPMDGSEYAGVHTLLRTLVVYAFPVTVARAVQNRRARAG